MLPGLTCHYLSSTITQFCQPSISFMTTCCHSWIPLQHSSTAAHCNLSQRAAHLPAGHLIPTAPHLTQLWRSPKHTQVRTQKPGAPSLPHTAFLHKVRRHFLSLCQIIAESGGPGGSANRGRNNAEADESSHQGPHSQWQHIPFTMALLGAWRWIWSSDLLLKRRDLLTLIQ